MSSRELSLMMFVVSFAAFLLSIFMQSLTDNPVEKAICRSAMFIGTTILFAAAIINGGF